MRTTAFFLPAILLMTACGSMQETTEVRDDVYDIPDRTLVASVDPVAEPEPEKRSDDYYNPDEASRYKSGSYWDRTYNDPQWYNQGRFGFGMNVNSWGPSYGMGFSYGSPYNSWYNSPGGWYDPYWSNSWQSGYGAWGNPYGCYNPWATGYYDPWGWSYPWGNNYGWGGYYGHPWGCNSGYGSGWGGYPGYYINGDFGSSYIVSHRPSMSGGGSVGGANVNVVPRAALQNNVTLMPSVTREKRPAGDPVFSLPEPRGNREKQKDRLQRPERNDRGDRPTRTRERNNDPSPGFDRGSGGDGGRSGGGGGSSPSTSPRPRR